MGLAVKLRAVMVALAMGGSLSVAIGGSRSVGWQWEARSVGGWVGGCAVTAAVMVAVAMTAAATVVVGKGVGLAWE